MVPACRTLDCVSIFAATCHDAHTVWHAARGFDAADPFSRARQPGKGAAPWLAGPFRFGVPAAEPTGVLRRRRSGGALLPQAVRDMEALGGRRVRSIFRRFRAAADLLYSGPGWPSDMRPSAHFSNACGSTWTRWCAKSSAARGAITAADAFEAEYRLRELRRAAEAQWAHMDILLLPTAGTIYTHEEVAADPDPLEQQSGLLHQFRESAGSGGRSGAGGLSLQRPALRRLVDRPGVQRRGAAGAGRSLPSRACATAGPGR